MKTGDDVIPDLLGLTVGRNDGAADGLLDGMLVGFMGGRNMGESDTLGDLVSPPVG